LQKTVKKLKQMCTVKQSQITMNCWGGGSELKRMTYDGLKYLEAEKRY